MKDRPLNPGPPRPGEIQAVCQITCVPKYFEGYADVPPESFRRKLRLIVRRSLSVRQVRIIKNKTTLLFHKLRKILGWVPVTPPPAASAERIRTGDRVRIRSYDEIKATLNPYGQLKGCMFMPEMKPYCDTVQRVFRAMERFVDERDYYVKRTSGILLLEGLYCQGTSDYGPCDRSCFYFWREEWVRKVPESPADASERP